jgi:hypothetical protein
MGMRRNQRRLARNKAKGTQIASRAKREWPAFLLDTREGDPQFVEEVKKAIHAFSFTELPPGQQMAYRYVATDGADNVLRDIREAAKQLLQQDPSNENARFAVSDWALTLGELILSKIPEPVRESLLPHNSVQFLPVGNDIIVDCRSLIKVETVRDPFWYSRLRPTVEIEGRTYTVAFSKHAIDKIKERINPDWKTFSALGDVFAYLEQCARFDVCHLLNTDRNGKPQLALTFYDICFQEEFWEWMYVTNVLGRENLDPNLGRAYHRVGYCPAFLDEARGFVTLGTLLCPGYRKTPEYGLLQASGLPADEKTRLERLAVEHSRDNLLGEQDFSAIKWFHENGIPQVIQTHERVYRSLPKRKYCISELIQK